MTQQAQSEALRLAQFFESMKKSSHRWHDGVPVHEKAAAELRRLHARVQELEVARKPLTDEQIREIEFNHTDSETDPYHPYLESIEFARAIERYHGIQEKPDGPTI